MVEMVIFGMEWKFADSSLMQDDKWVGGCLVADFADLVDRMGWSKLVGRYSLALFR